VKDGSEFLAGGPAEVGKNGLPAFRWNAFHGIVLTNRCSSTPHLESKLRSIDNYPDTGAVWWTIPLQPRHSLRCRVLPTT
jgi:hypothetical protein